LTDSYTVHVEYFSDVSGHQQGTIIMAQSTMMAGFAPARPLLAVLNVAIKSAITAYIAVDIHMLCRGLIGRPRMPVPYLSAPQDCGGNINRQLWRWGLAIVDTHLLCTVYAQLCVVLHAVTQLLPTVQYLLYVFRK